LPTSGLELLGRIAQEEIQTTVIVVTAFGTVETAVEAMKMGAYDYVTKPLDFGRVGAGGAPCDGNGRTSWKRCVLYARHSTSDTGLRVSLVDRRSFCVY